MNCMQFIFSFFFVRFQLKRCNIRWSGPRIRSFVVSKKNHQEQQKQERERGSRKLFVFKKKNEIKFQNITPRFRKQRTIFSIKNCIYIITIKLMLLIDSDALCAIAWSDTVDFDDDFLFSISKTQNVFVLFFMISLE